MPLAEQTGLHGLRVAGHDGTKWVLGSDVAEAHGLWKSGNNERYSRFKLSLVGKIPWAIMQLLGVEEQPSGRAGGSQDPLEREVAPPAQRLENGGDIFVVGPAAAAQPHLVWPLLLPPSSTWS